MKSAMCLILALALFLCAAFAEEVPGTVEAPYAGFRFVPPESFRELPGILSMDGISRIGGCAWMAVWSYYAMTEAELEALRSDHDPDAPPEYRICPLFFLLVLGGGMTFRSFNALNGNAIPAEFVREIGRAGETTFLLYMEGPNDAFAGAVDPVYAEAYTAMAGAADEVAAAFAFSGPREQADPYADLVGTVFAFTAEDLDGDPVSSEDLFAGRALTVVNIWTTWCAPCVAELPWLQDIHGRLAGHGCGVVGMLADDDADAARRLIAENGVTYPVILAPETLDSLIRLEAVPTTLFIGPDGTVLAPPVVGAYADEYEAVIDTLLGGE